jgi:hypothetical protein
LLGAIAVCSRPGIAENLVVNGGFEEPPVTFGGFIQVPAIPGWTLCSGNSIEVQNHVAGSPFEGQQFVELDSDTCSAICQDIPTAPGELLQLRFAFSPRPGVSDNELEVRWGGAVVAGLSADGSALSDTDWHVFTYTVTATGSATTLRFANLDVCDSLGTYLDAVSVTRAQGAPTVGGRGLLALALMLAAIGVMRMRRATH